VSIKPNSKIYALVDCNSFYASCERVFRPDLRGKPIAVLSNNDGCIVARSSELKELGIPMGVPAFKYEEQILKAGGVLFSSNYELYADLSNRVMNVLEQFTPELEVYSIDEAFLSLTGFKDRDLDEIGHEIVKTVFQWTGIPVSVGIGGTKTLAKLANHISKKYKKFNGVFSIYRHPKVDTVLDFVGVDKIWGIGSQYSRFLTQNGINTAKDLRDADSQWIRKYMTVVGSRTALELKGISCMDLDMVSEPKKGIVSSRSFGKQVSDYTELEEAVSTYMTRASEKLRYQKSIASYVTVFLGTNRFKSTPQYSNSMTTKLHEPSAYTPELIRTALRLLQAIYRTGFKYKKAGVMLGGIMNQYQVAPDAFEPAYVDDRRSTVMNTVDQVNERLGRDTLYYASCGKQQEWSMKREKLSPKYTTSWKDILTVK